MVRVLFVCLGNICRSPTAHAIFEQRVKDAGLSDRVSVDSAGTGDWHIGRPPDPRATEAAAKRGFDMSHLRARQFCTEDFQNFDYILAMDEANLSDIQALAPASHGARVELFLDYASHFTEREVPDPYYGGDEGFTHVLDLVEDAANGLLKTLQERGA
ncbi:protein-tyrosine phosphatase [Litorivivens lipolytica]|uniref:protein-tyrosine-phosphatase n=1 Tax=Litorivivens lipolytica TaxID=1524264 RepID=A0A7W4Z4P6_9GAMM|nr:protein-tyrosine phosphatase [Litorivivens lipolytica]